MRLASDGSVKMTSSGEIMSWRKKCRHQRSNEKKKMGNHIGIINGGESAISVETWKINQPVVTAK